MCRYDAVHVLCRWCCVHMVLCTCCTYVTRVHVALCTCHTCFVADMWYYESALCIHCIMTHVFIVLYFVYIFMLFSTLGVSVSFVLWCTLNVGVCVVLC